jgi:hypothetical protein
MQHVTQCKGGEQSGMKCNTIMNEQKDMTWYGGDLHQNKS